MHRNQRCRSIKRKRGVLHVILCKGVKQFGLDQASDWIITLLHLAVALFMAGLVAFLFYVNTIFAWSSLGLVTISGIVYIVLSALLALVPDCPYHLPFVPITNVIYRATILVLGIILAVCVTIIGRLCVALIFAFSKVLSPRRFFQDGARWAWGKVNLLISTLVCFCCPFFSPSTDLGLNVFSSRFQFSVERMLQRSDKIAELEDSFDSNF
jgi:hypothetical protein